MLHKSSFYANYNVYIGGEIWIGQDYPGGGSLVHAENKTINLLPDPNGANVFYG